MNEDPKTVAERMVSMYGKSKYTPAERASDHAFAYDSHESGRKFWIEVLNYINQPQEKMK
jgi:hypothetical protein